MGGRECTCPVGVDCKHVAALLIAGLAHQPKPTAAGVRAELVNWLEGFRARRTAANPAAKKKSAKATHALAYVIGQSYRGAEVFLYKARVGADGTIRSLDDPWQNVEKALIEPPRFVCD
ncbi:SWIM zinc finger family protein [Cupriavidus sp. D39]|uniref:SWIM zinc finger family protein n=1 Tax=Cupriavidus sp. D39 TaxID=2997877 RepID=UPI002270ACC3|nr:SWIM zinc finger family protein [Cupriavidus sp. D39]MCY0853526.1 SWIM zinc finger family protein [Cupriavidus sp. D39]